MIKTVIFDLGKVIIPFDFTRGYRGLEPVCDIPAAEIPKRIGATDLVHRFESGLVEPHDFVDQLTRMLDLRVGYDQFCEIWSSIFLPDPLIPESLLEGISRHSAHGVMKAQWDLGDFYQMAFRPQQFAPDDVELIHQGLALRRAGKSRLDRVACRRN